MNGTIRKSAALSLFAFSMMAVSCGDIPTPKKSPKTYKTLTISKGECNIEKSYSTSIRGVEYVDIRPQVSGVITKILINEGAVIKKGQKLFIIDQVPFKAALDVAKANVESAKASVATAKLNSQSAQTLFDKRVISENECQVAQNALASAQAALALAVAQETTAKNNLSYTEISSPVDGVVGMIPYRVGALVSSSISEPLVSVSSNDQMFGYFSMSESAVLALTRASGSVDNLIDSNEVDLFLNDGVKYEHKGEIDAISGTINRSTGTVSVRARFQNPEKLLRDGGNGSVVITTLREDVIVIPKIATFEIQNKILVYKIIDGKALSAQIKVYPLDNGKEYIVESGLAVGDVIVAEGAGLLREGTPINGAAKGVKNKSDNK